MIFFVIPLFSANYVLDCNHLNRIIVCRKVIPTDVILFC